MWKVAVEVHPRHANEFSQDHFQALESLIASPHVHALGEVGLDRTEPVNTWRQSEEVLTKVLNLASIHKPLVLHIRGPRRDLRAADVHSRCLNILKEYCARAQSIHLHCFTGELEQARNWVREFPYCFFGFTGKGKEFRRTQVEMLRKMPVDRLLLKTDSPHLSTVHG